MIVVTRFRRTWLLAIGAVVVILAAVQAIALAEVEGQEEFLAYLPVIESPSVPAFCGTQPVLLGPGNGAALNTLNPVFRWTNTNDPAATRVTLELATDNAFQNLVSVTGTGPSDGEREWRFIWHNLEPATRYFWRMFISCDDVDGPPSETRSFTTGSGGTILPAPALIDPADNNTVSAPVTLSWQQVSGAVEYLVILTYPSGGRTFINSPDNSLVWSFVDPGDTYIWEVVARNDYAMGTASEQRTFTVENSAQAPDTGLANALYFEDAEGNWLIDRR